MNMEEKEAEENYSRFRSPQGLFFHSKASEKKETGERKLGSVRWVVAISVSDARFPGFYLVAVIRLVPPSKPPSSFLRRPFCATKKRASLADSKRNRAAEGGGRKEKGLESGRREAECEWKEEKASEGHFFSPPARWEPSFPYETKPASFSRTRSQAEVTSNSGLVWWTCHSYCLFETYHAQSARLDENRDQI